MLLRWPYLVPRMQTLCRQMLLLSSLPLRVKSSRRVMCRPCLVPWMQTLCRQPLLPSPLLLGFKSPSRVLRQLMHRL